MVVWLVNRWNQAAGEVPWRAAGVRPPLHRHDCTLGLLFTLPFLVRKTVLLGPGHCFLLVEADERPAMIIMWWLKGEETL